MKKKIAFITQPEYFRFIYENDLDQTYEVREFPFKFDDPEENFKEVLEFNADYNIIFRGEFVQPNVLKNLKGLKIELSSEPFPRKIDGRWQFTLDSIYRYFIFRHRMRKRELDYIFHYDAASLPLLKSDGIQVSGELVLPIATGAIHERNLNKEYDMFFLGRSTPHREEYFGSLKHYYSFLHIAHGIYKNEEFSEYVNKARINLNVHAENEVSWEPRLQILLGSGAFVISEKITPNKYLIPGEDFVEVSNPQEIFEKVKYYLEHPAEMEPFVKSAKGKIDKYFVSKKVIPALLEDIDSGKYPKFKITGKGTLFFRLFELVYGVKSWLK